MFGLVTWLTLWLGGLTAMAATWSLLHSLWVTGTATALGLPYPMPSIGLINFVAWFVAEVAVLYFQIPKPCLETKPQVLYLYSMFGDNYF